MVVAECGRPVALPQLLPNTVRIHATAVDKPLGVIVEGNVDSKGSALFGALDKGGEDARYTRNAGAAKLLSEWSGALNARMRKQTYQ